MNRPGLAVFLAVAALTAAVLAHEFLLGLQHYTPAPVDGVLARLSAAPVPGTGLVALSLAAAPGTAGTTVAVLLREGSLGLVFDCLAGGPLGAPWVGDEKLKLACLSYLGPEGAPVEAPLNGGHDPSFQLLELLGPLGAVFAAPRTFQVTAPAVDGAVVERAGLGARVRPAAVR